MLISQEVLCSIPHTLYNAEWFEKIKRSTVRTPLPMQWFIRRIFCDRGSTIASHLLHHSSERSELFQLSFQRGLAISLS